MSATKPTTAKAEPSRCPKCQSTDRTKYHNVKEMTLDGFTPDGHRYNTVVWRRTQCKGCGQIRTDRAFELRSKRKSKTNRVAKPKTKSPHRGQKAAAPEKQASATNATTKPATRKPAKKAKSVSSIES